MIGTQIKESSFGGTRQWLSRVTTASKRSALWVDAMAVVWLFWLFDAVNAKAPVREALATNHGWDMLRLERSLHLTPELELNRWLAPRHLPSVLFSDYYNLAHFVVTFALLVVLWSRRSDIHKPLRNTLILINVIGIAVYWGFPVAPPRLLEGAGFMDIVADAHVWGSAHSGTGAVASSVDQYGAMPSLHIAWAAWCAVAIWQIFGKPWAPPLALAYVATTTFVVLATGNHYLVDVFAGLLTAALAFALANYKFLLRRWTPYPWRRGPVAQLVRAGDS